MLLCDRFSTRAAVDVDSTAVLALPDGSRIPCDKFIMRTFCAVIGDLLDSVTCASDERGRTVLPIVGPNARGDDMGVAVDVLHCCRSVWALTAGEVAGALRSLSYLGASVFDASLESRLWTLHSGATVLETVLEHAPRLLRNKALAAMVISRLITLRPVWTDFLADVLRPLEPELDAEVAGALVSYAPNFFPPALVVDWALDRCPHVTAELAMRLASHHGILYHAGEVPGVLRRLSELAEAWGPGAGAADMPSLLRMLLSSMVGVDAVPCTGSAKVHGSVFAFTDSLTSSAYLTLSGRMPARRTRLAAWLQVGMRRPGHGEGGAALDVRFVPSRLAPRWKHLQLRVMCFDAVDQARGACAEEWYLFHNAEPPHDHGAAAPPPATYDLSQAEYALGGTARVDAMLQAGTAKALRLDFFYGHRSVLCSPLDACYNPKPPRIL